MLLSSCNSEEDLEELFSRFGKILEVHLVIDKDTRRSKGIAYIQYAIPEFAARCWHLIFSLKHFVENGFS